MNSHSVIFRGFSWSRWGLVEDIAGLPKGICPASVRPVVPGLLDAADVMDRRRGRACWEDSGDGEGAVGPAELGSGTSVSDARGVVLIVGVSGPWMAMAYCRSGWGAVAPWFGARVEIGSQLESSSVAWPDE